MDLSGLATAARRPQMTTRRMPPVRVTLIMSFHRPTIALAIPEARAYHRIIARLAPIWECDTRDTAVDATPGTATAPASTIVERREDAVNGRDGRSDRARPQCGVTPLCGDQA